MTFKRSKNMKLTLKNHNDNARMIQRDNFEMEISDFLTNSILRNVENDVLDTQLSSCTLDVKEVNKDSFQIVINVDYVRDY
jgi:hypothetical protein